MTNIPGKWIPDVRSFSGRSVMLFGEASCCSDLNCVATSAKQDNQHLVYLYGHTHHTQWAMINPLKTMLKVKWSHYRPGVAQRVGRGIALLFHDRGTRMGWVVSSTPRPHFTPRGKTRYPFYRRLGGPQGLSGRVEYLVPTGFDPRTIQPVASRYTDWATGPTHTLIT